MSEQEIVTLSTGVNIRMLRPSRFIMQEKARQMIPKAPKAPKVFIKDKEVEEENPADPGFMEAMNLWNQDWARATENASILLGTAIESVPEGFQRPEDEEWAKELAEVYGIEVPASKPLRYCMWLKLWAIRTDEDAKAIDSQMGALLGIPQRKVDEQMESFRGGEERDADMGAPAEA